MGVNTASRMESRALPGAIQVTERVRERLCHRYEFEKRGTIEVKGKDPDGLPSPRRTSA
jgi:class 3 adenylate cyclase